MPEEEIRRSPVECRGDADCPAGEHIHGCFADDPCTHASECPVLWAELRPQREDSPSPVEGGQ